MFNVGCCLGASVEARDGVCRKSAGYEPIVLDILTISPCFELA